MGTLRNSPTALYITVLVVSIIVDTVAGLFFNYSMFDFWTQFFLGIVIVGAGTGFGFWTLRVLELNGVPFEHETPRVLIVAGPYALTRNPLYIAMTVIYVGVSVLFDSPIAILALIPLLYYMKAIVVPAEERLLREGFGEAYERYALKVKRWF